MSKKHTSSDFPKGKPCIDGGGYGISKKTESDDARIARITLTDLPVADDISDIREEIEMVTGMGRKHEVEQRIIHSDKLDAEFLKNMSIQISDGKILLMEYLYISCTNSYIYLDKDCKNPFYHSTGSTRARLPLPRPNATVLLKVFMDGKTEEIYRWTD